MYIALVAGLVAAAAVGLSIRNYSIIAIERQTIDLLKTQLTAERDRSRQLEAKVSAMEITIITMQSQLATSHKEYLQVLEKITNR